MVRGGVVPGGWSWGDVVLGGMWSRGVDVYSGGSGPGGGSAPEGYPSMHVRQTPL